MICSIAIPHTGIGAAAIIVEVPVRIGVGVGNCVRVRKGEGVNVDFTTGVCIEIGAERVAPAPQADRGIIEIAQTSRRQYSFTGYTQERAGR